MFVHLTVVLSFLTPPTIDTVDGCRNSLCSPGDLDGDGVADLVVAERFAAETFGGSGGQRGTVRALSGSDGRTLWTVQGESGFGIEVAAAGDLDGDGLGDVAVAAPRRDPQGATGAGSIELLSGADGGPLGTIAPPPGVYGFGRAVAAGGQLVGDATPDLVVGVAAGALVIDGAGLRPVSALWLDSDGEPTRAPLLLDAPASEGAPDPGGATDSVGATGPGGAAGPGGATGPDRLPAGFATRDAGGWSFGEAVHLLPDLDGDGLAEVLVGGRPPSASDRDAAGRSGFSFDVLSAGPGSCALYRSGAEDARTFADGAWAAAVLVDETGAPELLVLSSPDARVAALDLATGEERWATDYSGGYMLFEGATLFAVDDHDGDGRPDLAQTANETGFDCDGGFLQIHASTTGAVLRRVEVVRLGPDLTPLEPETCRSGYDLTPVADTDGDGFRELALHAPRFAQVRLLDGRTLAPRWNVDL